MSHPIERFEGDENSDRLLQAVKKQAIVDGDEELARTLIAQGNLKAIAAGEEIITQGNWDDIIYFILAGDFVVQVSGNEIGVRQAGTHVGEIARFGPEQARTATILARTDGVVLSLAGNVMEQVRESFPAIWKAMALVLSDRLDARNAMVGQVNLVPKVFVISSGERKAVADRVQAELDSREIDVNVWDKGVFGLSDYPISSLTDTMAIHDFTISVIAGDDQLVSRGETHAVPRDNVQLEYGLSVGMLGRQRSLLLVDADESVKLASDQAGLTTMRYNGSDMERTVKKACIEAREHIKLLGALQHRPLSS